jgi:glycolate oxidase FAD binding subunit
VDSDWDALCRQRVVDRRREVVIKAAAPISTSTTLVEILERQLGALEPTVWAHAGNGVAHAACSAPSDASVLHELRRQVQALGTNSSLVIERCPTVLKRAIDVWGDPGPSVALMRAIKNQLDPHATLNPGRYLGGI